MPHPQRHRNGPRVAIQTWLVIISVAGCGKATPTTPPSQAASQPSAPPLPAATTVTPIATALDASVLPSPSPASQAGEIFGVPVSESNYYFAKRVAYMFARPWGVADLPEDQRDTHIWEQLILHFESFRRGITASDADVDQHINDFLKSQQATVTRQSDPSAYHAWVTDHLGEPVELFENQVRYLLQIQALKDHVRDTLPVTTTEDELQQEFLNEKNHVGGEMVVFETKAAAETFYEQTNNPAAWDAMKTSGAQKVRPVSLMTLEAYIDLWSIPKEQMYAFHAMALGAVGPPMPFGRQWCVYRLLDKRTGDLKEFPAEREAYVKQVEAKKKYEALTRWIEELKTSAHLKVLLGTHPTRAAAGS